MQFGFLRKAAVFADSMKFNNNGYISGLLISENGPQMGVWEFGGLRSQNLCDKPSRKRMRSEVVRSGPFVILSLFGRTTHIDKRKHVNAEYRTSLGVFPLLHHGKGLHVCP